MVSDKDAFKPGHWRPGDLNYRTKVIFGIALSAEAILRGIDCVLIPTIDQVSGKVVAGGSVALTTWGSLFLVAAFGLLFGFMSKWGSLIVAACLIGGATYVSFAFATMTVDDDGLWRSIRLPGMYISFAACWFALAWATFEKLRRWAVLAKMHGEASNGASN